MPQSRAAMAVARAARPAARRARARPVRRARRQDDAPGGADGATRARSSPSSSTPAAPTRCAGPPRVWARTSSTSAPPTPPTRTPTSRSTASSSTRRAATSARSPRAPTRAGARPGGPQALAELQARILAAGAAAVQARRYPRLLDLHDLAHRERARRDSVPGRSRRFAADDLGSELPSGSIRPCRSTCRRSRTATAPTVSSSRGCGAHEPTSTSGPSARPAMSRGCGRRTSPAATAA